MIPAPFDYDVAETVDHALELLGERDGDAKLLAGGHSLLPALKLRIARPRGSSTSAASPTSRTSRTPATHVAIGALTRHPRSRRRRSCQEHCPIVSHTAGQVGDPQVRHRGTIGGSLAHGDPASDLPAVMLALGAELVVARAGRRAVDPGGRLLHRVLRDGARRRTRCSPRSGCRSSATRRAGRT